MECEVRVSQFNCDEANLLAPPDCVQYQVERQGRLTCLNFNDGSYGLNMSLTICLKLVPLPMVSSTLWTTWGLHHNHWPEDSGTEIVLPVRGLQGLTLDSDRHYLQVGHICGFFIVTIATNMV